MSDPSPSDQLAQLILDVVRIGVAIYLWSIIIGVVFMAVALGVLGILLVVGMVV